MWRLELESGDIRECVLEALAVGNAFIMRLWPRAHSLKAIHGLLSHSSDPHIVGKIVL